MDDKKTGGQWRVVAEYAVFVLLLVLLTGGLLALTDWLQAHDAGKSTVAGAGASGRVTVVLDAGHGGEDGGASGTAAGKTVVEKELNLDIVLRLRDLLALDGVQVVLTREEDVLLYDRNTDYAGRKKALDLAARLALTERTENPVLVSIHMNAYPKPQYSGLQVWYAPADAASRPLAETVQNAVREALQPENLREVKAADASIYLLHNAVCPAVLIECGFLSNPEECALLATAEYRQRLAIVLWQALKKALSEESPANTDRNCQKTLDFIPTMRYNVVAGTAVDTVLPKQRIACRQTKRTVKSG